MQTRENEHVRLFANYMNIAAGGTIVVALVTEPFTWTINVNHRPDFWTIAPYMTISFSLSILFHGIAQITLRRLEP